MNNFNDVPLMSMSELLDSGGGIYVLSDDNKIGAYA